MWYIFNDFITFMWIGTRFDSKLGYFSCFSFEKGGMSTLVGFSKSSMFWLSQIYRGLVFKECLTSSNEVWNVADLRHGVQYFSLFWVYFSCFESIFIYFSCFSFEKGGMRTFPRVFKSFMLSLPIISRGGWNLVYFRII